jgi:hypothetical protein
MNIDPKRLFTDESVSNPMAVGMRYPDCPINRTCFHIVVGFGSIIEQCPHLKDAGETAECTQDVSGKLTPGEMGA